MMRTGRQSWTTALALLLLSVVVVIVNGLQITKQRMTIRPLQMPGFGAEVALIELTFDEDITVSINGVATSFADLTGGDKQSVNILKAAGVADILCTISGTTIAFSNVNSIQQQQGGPPTGSIVVLPTDEPGSTFLGTMSGYKFPATVRTDRFTIVLILRAFGGDAASNPRFDGRYSHETVGNGQCVVRFPDPTANGNRPLASALHPSTIFTGSSDPLVMESNQCTLAGEDRVEAAVQEFQSALSNITTKDQMNALQFAAGAFTVFEAWAGCQDIIRQMYTTKSATQELTNVNGCIYPFGSAQFAASNCCNQTLRYSECCAPHTATFPYRTFDKINSVFIEGLCHHPDLIRPVLLSYLDAVERFSRFGDAIGGGDGGGNWDTLRTFERDCDTALMSTSCLVDGDCIYTKSCNKNSQTCNFDWNAPQLPYARCYLDKADKGLLHELLRIWNVDPNSATLEADVADVFATRFASMDCAGPSGDKWRKQFTTAFDNNGNPYGITIPGNQTGCLLKKACNWNSWQNGDDETKCIGANVLALKGDHFCGSKNGGNSNYQDLTVLPQCQVTTNIQSEAQCLLLGATTHQWISFGPGGNGGGNCLFTGAHNISSCLSSPFCTDFRTRLQNAITAGTYTPFAPQFSFDSDCGQSWCYFSDNITVTQQVCQQYQSQAQQALNQHGFSSDFIFNGLYSLGWDVAHRYCRFAVWGASSVDQNATLCRHASDFAKIPSNVTVVFSEGRTFRPGQWSNAQECAVGQCMIPKFNYFGVTEQTCTATVYCTKQCAYCTTFQRDQSGFNEQTLCYDPSITTQQSCSSPGHWNFFFLPASPNGGGGGGGNGGGSQQQACVYDYTQTQCATAGLTFRACSDLLTETRCMNYSTGKPWEYRALQCQWNTHADCRNAQECESQGECDDWEFQSFSQSNGPNPFVNGACVKPFMLDPQNGNMIQCQQQQQQQGNSWSRIGCIDPTITTSAACTAAGSGYHWETRASNAAGCSAHGQGCRAPDWPGPNLIGRNVDECTSCKGQMKDQYRWTFGEVVPGPFNGNLQWIPRAMVSENSWQSTLDRQLLENDISAAAAVIMGRRMVATMNGQFRAVLPMHSAVACDCNPNLAIREDCFNAVQIPDCSCTLLPGLASDQTCSCPGGATYTFPPSAIVGTRPVQIFLSGVPAGFAMAAPQTSNPPPACSCTPNLLTGVPDCSCQLVRRYNATTDSFEFESGSGTNLMVKSRLFMVASLLKSTLFATDDLSGPAFTGNPAVVHDYHENVVGQVVGSAQTFISDSSVVYPISVCMPIDPNIVQDATTYPVADFATPEPFLIGPPLNATSVQVSGNQLCGLIGGNGTYYPIIRETFWNHTSHLGGAASGLTTTQIIILATVLPGVALIAVVGGLLYRRYSHANGGNSNKYNTKARLRNKYRPQSSSSLSMQQTQTTKYIPVQTRDDLSSSSSSSSPFSY